ncbi:MAG TPA: hypothetical protein GX707_15000 [Epulopiscium sp.]|nr:hypothetical protein [Candidatus Epulonipiscium sp.]
MKKLNKFNQYIFDNIAKLNRKQLLTLLNDMKKSSSEEVLCNTLKERILSGDQSIEDIYNKNMNAFSLKSNEVEDVLNKNKSYIAWLKKQEVIKIDRCEAIYRYGKTLQVPYWNAKELYELADDLKRMDELEQKRSNEKELAKQAGIEKQKATRKKNDKIRKKHEKQQQDLFKKWEGINKAAAPYFELAFWTVWVSRWAKNYKQEYRVFNNIVDNHKGEEYYGSKLEAIKVLATTPYAKVSLYHPSNPDYIDIDLCKEHKEDWQLPRSILTLSPVKDYYKKNKDIIESCPDCFIDIYDNYYSLFHIKMQVEGMEETFSFHLPYSKGLGIFCEKDYPIETNVVEREGLFRFGRPVAEQEKLVYTESKTKKKFEKILKYVEQQKRP